MANQPGEWFDQTLESLATQSYARLEVMVIDSAGDPSTAGRVRSVVPNATVLDASDTVGFGAAANAVLDTEAESAFLLVCHDDIALERDAVRIMVSESLRSNSGIVGPKFVEWDRPDRLQHVGLRVDRFGVPADVVDPAELDQEQYDYVSDFSAIPTACMLVRADLFRQIGGFDPEITFRGDDVDLCWRAQLAGARVMVAPDAVARHIENLISRTQVDDVRRTRARHQLRTVLTTSSLPSLVLTIPLHAALVVGETVVAVATGSFRHVGDVLGAYVWNLRRSSEILRRRRQSHDDRKSRFREVKQSQERGSVRISAFIRGQIGRNRGGIGAAGRGLANSMRSGTSRMAWLVLSLIVAFILFGSRSLISNGIPAIGDFSAFPADSGDLISQWWNGWRARDLGSPGAVPSGVALLGAFSWLSGGSLGLVRTGWIIAPLFVGLLGSWRMLSPTGSRRAQIAGALAYVIVPLPWASLASGSLSGIYAYALAPWVLAALLKSQSAPPHPNVGSSAARVRQTSLALGLAVAVAMLFEPTTVVVVPIIAVGLVIGGLVSAHPAGTWRLLLTTALGGVTAMVLSLPLVLDLLAAAPTWDVLADGHTGSATSLRLDDIVRFGVGPNDPGPLVWFMAVPMVLPLLVGRSWRFEMAAKAIMVCLSGWGLTLLVAVGAIPFGLPDPAVLLAAPAVALVALAGLAVASVEHDLRMAGFGWRQLLLPLAVASAAISSIPAVGLLQSGRWDLGNSGFEHSLPLASPATDGSYRVLWVGAPEFLPVSGRPLVGSMAWTATLDGIPTLADRFVPADDGSSVLIRSTVLRAVEGQTSRLGRDLGGLGIRYVVMVERLQPSPFSSADDAVAIPPALVNGFSSQLDLERVEGTNSSIRVFENTEWTSVRAALAPGFDDEVTALFDLETAKLPGSTGVLAGSGESIHGPIPAGTEVLVSQSPDPGWSLEVDGQKTSHREAIGWATAYTAGGGGTGDLVYSTPLWRQLALLLQVVMFAGIAVVSLRRLLLGGRG